jgi:nicotinate-nucleotide pyrophosphorylase (carboxylating)
LYNRLAIEELVARALMEDMNYGDVTTDNLIEDDQLSEGMIIGKETGVVAGIFVAEMVFKKIDEQIDFCYRKKDGDLIKPGECIAIIRGKTKSILKGERVALNFLQRMSGIASQAKQYADAVSQYPVKIVDTRKTTPGLRILEKYAVRMGGCYNHRFNLSDSVMIKDNHIKGAGGISKAIEKLRKKIPHTMKIEVEVESLNQLYEALDVGADIVLLDNMTIEMMKEAVQKTKKRAILEASGNITIDNIKSVAETGVNVISIGALTYAAKALDISLDLVSNDE